MLVFAPKIFCRSESTSDGSRTQRRRRDDDSVPGQPEPKFETKELVRKLVEVIESILKELSEKFEEAPSIRVGYAIGSDNECEKSIEKFRSFKMDILVNVKVLERSADFPMINTVLDLHSHSTPDSTGKGGAYAAAIQRFTRAARIINLDDPAIKRHPKFALFAPRLESMRMKGDAQKMIIFELDMDPRDWILKRFCAEENSLLTFGESTQDDRSLEDGGWVVMRKDDKQQA
jgi:hypothetical protein